MICTVIQNKTLQQILGILPDVEMAEIRLDRCVLTDEEIEECFESDVPLVATCRVSEVMASMPDVSETGASLICETRLCKAIVAGARYVDVEIEAPRSMARRVRSCARENGTVFIRSYHDFSGTPSAEILGSLVEKCRKEGAELVKMVTTALSDGDAGRVLSLYDSYPSGDLIAFAMGEKGRDSRVACLAKGAPYTYASLTEDDQAAPGQWSTEDMYSYVYKGRKFLNASVAIPSSKSFAQRAVIAAALAEGTSHLGGYSPCGDNESALKAASAVGAEVSRHGDCVEIKGIGAVPGGIRTEELHTGESGLLTRLMIPLMAQISSSPVRITGEKTLLDRPMTGAEDMMSRFGVSLSGESGDCRVPLTVCGPLRSGKAEISGRNGSQLISGLLMSLPLGDRNSSVLVHSPKSIPYMFITLDVMRKFGVKVSSEMQGGQDFLDSGGDWSKCTEIVFRIKGNQHYKSADFIIEGDWSSAANFLVAGAVFGKVCISNLDTESLQADLSIMDILMDAGASLSQTDGSKGPVTVQRAPLSAFTVDASNCPDLFPIVSVLAAFCQGTSRIGGIDRLAHKESDRGKAILDMLHRMDVKAEAEGNELVVEGMSLARRCLTGHMLKGGKYSSYHDHRMVMALKVAGLGADSAIEIDDEKCVDKSFPDFPAMFAGML